MIYRIGQLLIELQAAAQAVGVHQKSANISIRTITHYLSGFLFRVAGFCHFIYFILISGAKGNSPSVPLFKGGLRGISQRDRSKFIPSMAVGRLPPVLRL